MNKPLLTVDVATQAINALTDYRVRLGNVEVLRARLTEEEADLSKTMQFLEELGLFGVHVAESIPLTVPVAVVEPLNLEMLPVGPIVAVPELVAVDLPRYPETPGPDEMVSPVSAPPTPERVKRAPATKTEPRLCPGFNVPDYGKVLCAANKGGVCLSCHMRRVQAEKSHQKLAQAAGPETPADTFAASGTPSPKPVTEAEMALTVSAELSTELGSVDSGPPEEETTEGQSVEAEAKPADHRVPPMPSCKIGILENTTLFRYVLNARASAMNDPAVIEAGVCHLAWEWAEDKNRWDVVYSPWEAGETSLGMIEHLRRQGDVFINTSGQTVGRAI